MRYRSVLIIVLLRAELILGLQILKIGPNARILNFWTMSILRVLSSVAMLYFGGSLLIKGLILII